MINRTRTRHHIDAPLPHSTHTFLCAGIADRTQCSALQPLAAMVRSDPTGRKWETTGARRRRRNFFLFRLNFWLAVKARPYYRPPTHRHCRFRCCHGIARTHGQVAVGYKELSNLLCAVNRSRKSPLKSDHVRANPTTSALAMRIFARAPRPLWHLLVKSSLAACRYPDGHLPCGVCQSHV